MLNKKVLCNVSLRSNIPYGCCTQRQSRLSLSLMLNKSLIFWFSCCWSSIAGLGDSASGSDCVVNDGGEAQRSRRKKIWNLREKLRLFTLGYSVDEFRAGAGSSACQVRSAPSLPVLDVTLPTQLRVTQDKT